VASLEAALASKSLADANQVDAALAAAETARAGEAEAAGAARAEAVSARRDAAAAALEGRLGPDYYSYLPRLNTTAVTV